MSREQPVKLCVKQDGMSSSSKAGKGDVVFQRIGVLKELHLVDEFHCDF